MVLVIGLVLQNLNGLELIRLYLYVLLLLPPATRIERAQSPGKPVYSQ